MSRYDATSVEKKWQDAWEKAGTFAATRDESKPKYYVLPVWPHSYGPCA